MAILKIDIFGYVQRWGAEKMGCNMPLIFLSQCNFKSFPGLSSTLGSVSGSKGWGTSNGLFLGICLKLETEDKLFRSCWTKIIP